MNNVMSDKFVEFYDQIAVRYFDYKSQICTLKSILGLAKNVLELGAGTGNVAIPLASEGFSVTGIDNSQKMFEKFSKKPYWVSDIHYYLVNADEIDFAFKFDAIYSFSGPLIVFNDKGDLCLDCESEEVLNRIIIKVKEHLRRNGLFIINIEDWKNIILKLEDGYIYERKIVNSDFPFTRRHTIFKYDKEITSFEVETYRIELEVFKQKLSELGFGNFQLSIDMKFFSCNLDY